MENTVLKAIYERRSVRHFAPQAVEPEKIYEVLKAGAWAPSGLNNQPWRFAIVIDEAKKKAVSELTRYKQVVLDAPVLLPVFIDKTAMYHATKDHQSMGACLQNMLLAAHSLGLGAVWLGEILKNAEAVRNILALPENLELMAVIAMGYAAKTNQTSNRKTLNELIAYNDLQKGV
ncbi:MAG: nitroreductase [Deltaproteobacteria bacterium]|jgi:nitroreductase|nr:nitroreductase [Deltaproteobacteria bacterium]